METSRVSGILKDTGWRWLGGVNYSKGVEVGMVLHIDGLVQDCSNSSELTGNGSDNGLAPARCQAIIWTIDG